MHHLRNFLAQADRIRLSVNDLYNNDLNDKLKTEKNPEQILGFSF